MRQAFSASSRNRTRAVLFDLYGTLVPGGTPKERDDLAIEVARDLDVDGVALARLYRESFDQRARGLLGDVKTTLATFAGMLGSSPTDDDLMAAVKRRRDFTLALHKRTRVVPVLEHLRDSNLLLGLVTDCSAETTELWNVSPLARFIDAASFSCEMGARKPHATMYLSVTDALNVECGECLYVGDGGSNELTGSVELGMRAIWFDDGAELERQNPELAWSGERITDLTMLSGFLTN